MEKNINDQMVEAHEINGMESENVQDFLKRVIADKERLVQTEEDIGGTPLHSPTPM